MPELPEVETIRRGLAGRLIGKRIGRVQIRDIRALQGFDCAGRPRRRTTAVQFRADVEGQKVGQVLRRGKYLIIELDPPKALLCHLRMTGQLILGPADPKARARIFFEGSEEALNFLDVRRFGELWFSPDWKSDPALAALGPEPLADWDQLAWARRMRSLSARVHAALLNQSHLAGLGNIYAIESLFRAGVRPGRRCHTVPMARWLALAGHIRDVLEEGIRFRGVSFYSYRDVQGDRGQAQNRLSVYGRGGESCLRCRDTLRQTKISSRSAVYCAVCQE